MYKKWDEWLDVLGNQIIDLYTQRHIYKQVRQILEENPKVQQPDDFLLGICLVLIIYGCCYPAASR
jgi:hypothetical protein